MMASHSRNEGRLPHPIPEPLVELIAHRFRVLGQPLRIRVIDHLANRGETSVQALADELAATQQNISKHLAMLRQSGVLARRQDGRVTWYKVVDEEAYALLADAAFGLLREIDQLARETQTPSTDEPKQ